jgi:hypothetical protein
VSEIWADNREHQGEQTQQAAKRATTATERRQAQEKAGQGVPGDFTDAGDDATGRNLLRIQLITRKLGKLQERRPGLSHVCSDTAPLAHHESEK